MRRSWSIATNRTLWTTATNLCIVGVTMLASIMVARALGPEGRGEFATLMAVFALAIVLGEFGQSASVTYYVSLPSSDQPNVVAAGRRIMLTVSFAVVILGLAVHFLVLSNKENAAAFAIVLLGCLANAAGAPSLYALQAVSIPAWNGVRAMQPTFYVAIVGAAYLGGVLSLVALALALVASTSLTLVIAAVVARRRGLSGGRAQSTEVRRLSRFGAKAASAGIPISLGQNLDKLLLNAVASASFIGHYAVASSVAGLTQPFATAVASVVFPQISREESADTRRRLGRLALGRHALIGLPLTLGIAISSSWFVPFVFGPDFEKAVPILWAVAPGQFLRANNVVLTSLLRGDGRPGAAAKSQITAAVGFLVALVPLVMLLDGVGLGVALLLGEGLGFVVAWRHWVRGTRSGALTER